MEEPELDPIEFELPNGHSVRVEHQVFHDAPTRAQRFEEIQPRIYSAILIFSTEESTRSRLELWDELRSGATFDPSFESQIWDWLGRMVVERRFRAYDWVEEFIEDFHAAIARICAEGEDAVEHIEKLPQMEAQPLEEEDDFDPTDDSHFNDQNQPEESRFSGTKPHLTFEQEAET